MRKIAICVCAVLLIVVSIPLTAFAVESSDFSIKIASAKIDDNILTIDMDATFPPTEVDGKTYTMFATFKANDKDLVTPAEGYDTPPLSLQRGGIYWSKSYNSVYLVFGHENIKEAYEGGTLGFQIKFDVSSLNLELPVKVDIYPDAGYLASYSSTAVYANPDTVLATYTINEEASLESVYSISPVISAEQLNVPVNDTFDVDVVVSADQADAALASVDAVLNYDKDLVEPVHAAVKMEQSDAQSHVSWEDGKGIIKLFGEPTVVGESGVTVATYTFKAVAPGEAAFSIADGALVGRDGNQNEIDAVSGDPVKVVIEETGKAELVSNDESTTGSVETTQLLKYTAKSMPADGNAYFYGDMPLMYTGQDTEGQYVFRGFVDSSLTLETLEAIEEKTGAYETILHDGDVNRNEKVNAIDCQIAYDLGKRHEAYFRDSGFDALSMRSRLEADVNDDGVVDALDCRAIMYLALGLTA